MAETFKTLSSFFRSVGTGSLHQATTKDINRAKELSGFFDTKTIQRPYNFFVTVINDDRKMLIREAGATRDTLETSLSPKRGISDFEEMPKLKSWHVVDVTLQNYSYKKEIVKYGILPRSFPVLEFDGFEITVTFEEDKFGTIQYFINWLQQRIIQPNGIYRHPGTNKIDALKVEIKENEPTEATGEYKTVVAYTFPDIYFLRGEQQGPLNYGSSDSIKYAITFGADSFEQEFKNFGE